MNLFQSTRQMQLTLNILVFENLQNNLFLSVFIYILALWVFITHYKTGRRRRNEE